MINFRVTTTSFIVDENNNILLLKRRPNDPVKPGAWEIPGGRLELGEDPFIGLKRETKEETNLDIEISHPINVKHFTRSDGQTITMIIFACRPQHKDVKISEEHTAFEWVPLELAKDKLTDFLHPEVDIFQKLELHKHL